MQDIGYIIDKLLRNHIYKIKVIHWISYQPFEQLGPEMEYSIRIGICFNAVFGSCFRGFY